MLPRPREPDRTFSDILDLVRERISKRVDEKWAHAQEIAPMAAKRATTRAMERLHSRKACFMRPLYQFSVSGVEYVFPQAW
jgi:hypothetical protein